MPIAAAAIMAGGSLLGGMMQGSSARRAAEAQSRAQIEAARIAAEEARFRPVGVTTRFGQSQFTTGPDGRVSGASYELTPELREMQDRFMALTGRGLTQAEEAQGLYSPFMGAATGLFGAGQRYLSQPTDQRLAGLAGQYLGAPAEMGVGAAGQRLLGQPIDQQILDIARQQLAPSQGAQAITALGQQYLAQSPQEAAQQYMARQQDLLAPSRERQMAQLQNQLFQTGRSGLAVGATGARPGGSAGLGAASPEMEAYYNALAQQDAALAAQATQAGQQQAQFGAGLLSTGQALGQGQLGFGVNLLAGEQARELARVGAGAGLIGQEEALNRARYGFGADLLGRQIAMEQGQLGFGAGLFGTAGNLLGQMYGGQTAALGPYQAYLGGMTGLEALGQQPLELGSALGGRIANPYGGASLLKGGTEAAASQYRADAYNPFATALVGASQNPDVRRGIEAYRQPYINATEAIRQYGSENVYGYGGGGRVPTISNRIFEL